MSETTIQCANPGCQAINSIDRHECEQCQTPLIKRYLWSIGDWIKAYRVGELLEERYLLKYPRILLDTKPGLTPNTPDEMPGEVQPYLKLFPYRVHIPQIYSYFPSPEEAIKLDVWLLEYGSLPLTQNGELRYGEAFLPALTDRWGSANPLRQLHWLWQMAKLWQPLQSKGVVSSLLDPSLLKINGELVQILELKLDPNQAVMLKQVGKLWSSWIETASSSLRSFLTELCQRLEQGKINNAQSLIEVLDKALEECSQSYQYRYEIFTATDQGPSREHNEDACYPPENERIDTQTAQPALTIVCDGIGGQEGGEIASALAIETLVEEFSKVMVTASPKPPSLQMEAIEQAIRVTNNRISQRNDRENRQERQRMGTTAVIGLSRHHEMYLAHVGDSRIYWITPDSCHQVTVDDDLASREVRLGYLLYRNAVDYPNAGALVQALGMSDGKALHPNIQRWILAEDCIFLLCSDGLSDYDRVDQYWQTEITPLLQQETEIEAVGKRLIEIANEKNGHDNVTIALIYCKVSVPDTITPLVFTDALSIEETTLSNSPELDPLATLVPEEDENTEIQQELPKQSHVSAKSKSPIAILLGILLLVGLSGFGLWQFLKASDSNPPDEINPPTEDVNPSATETPLLDTEN